jgi:hypothetical protein
MPRPAGRNAFFLGIKARPAGDDEVDKAFDEVVCGEELFHAGCGNAGSSAGFRALR